MEKSELMCSCVHVLATLEYENFHGQLDDGQFYMCHQKLQRAK